MPQRHCACGVLLLSIALETVMIKSFTARLLMSATFATGVLLAALPAGAAGTTSLGHGVKCSWVLVSTVGIVNTYKQVCRKSGV